MTAVLGMSSGETGIWWYARTRSSLEKNVAPCKEEEKSCRRVAIRHGGLVEGTVVTTGSPVTGGLLGDHVEG